VKKGVDKTTMGYTFCCFFGGGEKQHRWRADNQKVGGRRAREKVDGRGRRERQQKKRLSAIQLLIVGEV
jgi:hypothetical protein